MVQEAYIIKNPSMNDTNIDTADNNWISKSITSLCLDDTVSIAVCESIELNI